VNGFHLAGLWGFPPPLECPGKALHPPPPPRTPSSLIKENDVFVHFRVTLSVCLQFIISYAPFLHLEHYPRPAAALPTRVGTMAKHIPGDFRSRSTDRLWSNGLPIGLFASDALSLSLSWIFFSYFFSPPVTYDVVNPP